MKKITTFVLLVAALASLAVAADKPNFSGDWKIDNDKSNFGPMPPPSSLTRKIKHDDPAVAVDEASSGAQGDMNRSVKYDTSGKETTNDFMGTPTKSTAAWDGAKLGITTKASFGVAQV